MIVDEKILKEKLHKKLLPEKIKVTTSFLCFINTEENNGLVTYLKNNIKSPFCLEEEIKFKRLKLKNQTFEDLITNIDKILDNNKKFIKKTRTAFYDEFNTSCEVKFIKNIYELNLVNDTVVFNKRIVCVCTEVENIERSFNSNNKCEVVPLENIKNINEIYFDEWLVDLINQN